MKKNLLKSMIALAAFCLGGISAYAQNQVGTAPVKMTYVQFDNALSKSDSVFGQKDTITVGYNTAPAVDGTMAWGRADWNANFIGYLQVNATAIAGTVQKATLKVKISGSTDSKRGTSWGLALTDNAWSDKLSYDVTKDWKVTKLLNNGTQIASSQKSAKVFDEVSFDITDALTGAGASSMATIIVFETAAAGGYMTEPVVEVEYEPYEKAEKKIDFEDGDVSMFSIFEPDMIDVTAEDNADLGSKVAKFAYKSRSKVNLALYDFTELAGTAALVNLEFDFNVSEVAGQHRISIGDALVHNGTSGGFKSGNNNWNYGGNGAILQLGVERGKLNGSSNENYFVINDVAKAGSTLDLKAADVFGQWMHAKVSVNVEARTVSYEISKGEEILFSGESLPFYSENANACTEFDVSFSNSGTSYVDNLSIVSYKSNAVFADYTIKYVDGEGNEIKESRKGNGQVGKFVTLIDTDKASIYNADKTKKYIYKSDNSETVAIADGGTAVITVTFRDAEVYAGVLNCMIDGQTGADARLASFSGFSFFEGDKYYVYPSRGYGKDGKYYFTDATSWNGVTFTFPGSLNSRTISGVVTYIGQLNYVLDESVAYYSDFERLALPVEDAGEGTGLGQLVGTVNNWWSFSNGIFDRFSQGRGIRLDADSYVYTEPIAEAGTYFVQIYGRNDKSAANEKPYVLGLLKDGEVKYFDVAVPTWGSATTGYCNVGSAPEKDEDGNVTAEGTGIGIPAGGVLVIANTNADGLISLDDIKLTKVADYKETPIATGIQNIEKIQNAGIIYNLNGQVVKATKKGLYIQNGKKFVVK